jgi:hypothetical protein
MAINYTRANPVNVGDPITSAQHNNLANAFNDRLAFGVGDATWRLHWGAHSLVRNIRLSSGSLTPPEDEWWKIYCAIDPRKTAITWPTAGPGLPEGVNDASPLGAFVFGDSTGSVADEDGRLNYDGVPNPPTGIKLWPGGSPPATLADYWDLAKDQRGAVPVTLDDFQAANALRWARDYWRIYYPLLSPWLKDYGGFAPGPEHKGTCTAGEQDYELQFKSLQVGPADKTFRTCPENPTDVEAVIRGVDGYYLYKFNGSVEFLDYTDWLEGPYSHNPWLTKEHGQQLRQMQNWFASEFRAREADRDPGGYNPALKGFDFTQFHTLQYPLAPAYGEVDLDLVAKYEEWKQTGNAPAGTHLTRNPGPLTAYDIHPGFVFAGYYARVESGGSIAQPVEIEARANGVRVASINLTPVGDQRLQYFGEPPKDPATIEFVLMTDLVLSGDLVIEIAELMDYKPNMHDAYLVLRTGSTDGSTANIDERGLTYSQQKEVGDNLKTLGCIVNATASGLPDQNDAANAINQNPAYEAARRLVFDHLRMIDRTHLSAYEVSGGKSILHFVNRYASGLQNEDVDLFRGIAPPVEDVASGEIKPGIVYINNGPDTVTYDGTPYTAGQTFAGVWGKKDYTVSPTTAEVRQYDGIILTAPPQGYDNRWLLHMSTVTYHTSESSPWKLSAYGDIKGHSHDRCGHFSNDWDNALTQSNHMSNLHIAYGANTVDIAENPPGYRYVDGTHETQDNHLITAQGVPTPGPANHFKSCRLYEPAYGIESVIISGTEIKVTLTGRVTSHPSAPATIAKDRGAWLDPYADEDYRTDENAIREYLNWVDSGENEQCLKKVGDIAPEVETGYSAGDFFGSCVPRFYFTRLARKVYEDANTSYEVTDTPIQVDDMVWMQWILKAICAGFIDSRSTLALTCTDPDNIRYYDYTFENLCYEALNHRWLAYLPKKVRGDRPEGFGPLPNTTVYAELFNNLAACINLLCRARIDLPLVGQSQQPENTIGATAVDPDLEEKAIVGKPDPCIGKWVYTSTNAAVWEALPAIATTGESAVPPSPVVGFSLAFGQLELRPYTTGDDIYMDCAPEWLIAAHKQVGQILIDTTKPELNALPPTIRDMVETNPGIIGVMEEFWTYRVRDDVGGTRPECGPGNTPFPDTWDDGATSATPKFTETAEQTSYVCVLWDGGEIQPQALPPDFVLHAHRPTGVTAWCVGVVIVTRTLFPSTAERFFVKIPLV